MSNFKKVCIESYNEGGFKSYRIPGMVVSSKGTIIVYYETRLAAYDDWSAVGVGMKRSTDGGNTFCERQMIATSEDLPVNNPLMIASRDGRIHFLWQKDYRQLFYQVSTDDGITFSEPISVIDSLMEFKDEFGWSLFAIGPGHGIEMKNGRLVVPVWLARGKGNDHFPTHVSTIISDDGGITWHRGEVIYSSENWGDDFVSVNESQVVELSDGSVLINMRHNGNMRYRYTAISPNGQDGFSTPIPDKQLPDAICFGSLVRAGDKIVFVNCANNEEMRSNGWPKRTNLTVRISYDDAKTWVYSRQIAGLAGYADIASSPDGKTYYCFFEDDNPPEDEEPAQLTLAILDEAYLMEEN